MTNDERTGIVAFVVIEACAVIVFAPAFTVIASLGMPASESSSTVYVRYALMLACWCGALALPVSVSCMFLWATASSKPAPTFGSIARTLAFEVAVVGLMTAFHVELGAPFGEPAPQLSDLRAFGIALLVMAALCAGASWLLMPTAVRVAERRRRLA